MNPIFKNIVAVVIGIVIGSTINMALISISSSIIPPPEGADITTIEGLKASIHLFKPINFIFPFLAHALGTLIGAFLAAKLAASHHMKFAYGIGFFFLLGGIANVFMLPAPMWFNVLDLVLAYLPMAYLGGKMATKK
ncbi:MAG TPA: hypothetical protein PLL09_09950 [Flavobacterium sp.]|uniref:hypothetical protein n=1 Tax=unclassified Flavobacterium TaxID=196869 RepID=UPI0025C5203F|nr:MULTISPECIES: hypothetical protein [unclassified Flavobacterium]HRE78132.1 hypothetical protein [Flavobacterium sp.]